MKTRNKILKPFYIFIGIIFFGLGIIGIILPILPTVPFFLLTSFCFAKGSTRFHKWFLRTKLYKKYVSGFVEHRSMSIGGQLFLMIFVSLMLASTCLMVKDSLAIMIILPVIDLGKYIYFITSVKTVTKEELKVLKARKKLIEASA